MRRRDYYPLLAKALGRALAVKTNLIVNAVGALVILVLVITNNDAAATNIATLNFGIPRIWFVLPVLVLVVYDVLEAQRVAYNAVLAGTTALHGRVSELTADLERATDQTFANAPLLRWQTPSLTVGENGGLEFSVFCTNEGGQPANIKARRADWSTLEPVTMYSVDIGTTIYEGVYHRCAFVVSTGVVFGTAYRRIEWSVRYADNAGRHYDTKCWAECYLDSSYGVGSVGEVESWELDRDSNAKERYERVAIKPVAP